MTYIAIYTRQLHNKSVNPKTVSLFEVNNPASADDIMAVENVVEKFKAKARTQGRAYISKPIADAQGLTDWYAEIGYPLNDVLTETGKFKIAGTPFTETNPLKIIMSEEYDLEPVWEEFTNVELIEFV